MSVEGNAASTYELRGKLSGVFSNIIDNTLTIEGAGADAKATGDAIKGHTEDKNNPHGVTAAQVGARPDTWMPNALQVGARPNTWMPTAAEVGARPNDWMPTASQVGAAPGGYGLGGGSTAKGVESITANGWYITNVNTPDSNYWLCQTFVTNNGNDITVEAWNLSGTAKMKRTKRSGTWGAWEAMIPTMSVNAEIRTTERYNGKTVFAKLVNFGALPNNTEKRVAYRGDGTANAIFLTATLSDGCVIGAGQGRDRSFSNTKNIWLDCTRSNIKIVTDDDFSSLTAMVLVKYTLD